MKKIGILLIVISMTIVGITFAQWDVSRWDADKWDQAATTSTTTTISHRFGIMKKIKDLFHGMGQEMNLEQPIF